MRKRGTMAANATASPREVAQLLGIRLDAVYSLIWAARLTAVKCDGRWLVDRAAVDERVKVKVKVKRQSGTQHHCAGGRD